MNERSPEDQVRLAAAWLKSGRPEVICVSCGGIRQKHEPPCTCQRHASTDRYSRAPVRGEQP